jgi:predicted membrane protein
MVPFIELRGSIPIGIFAYKLDIFFVYIISILGNIIIIPVILLGIKKMLKLLEKVKVTKKLVTIIEQKGKKAGDKILKSTKNGVYYGLFIFVAIPLPGTGAWTGSLAAAFLDLDFKKSFISIALGVITAGIIIFTLSVIGVNILK